MHYWLKEDLSCCDVDGHLIFLDVAQDRYFKLTGTLEEAMRHFQAHEDIAPTLVESLAAAQILVEAPNQKTRVSRTNIRRPTCSALERTVTVKSQRVNIATVFEVMAIIWSTRHQLRAHPLKATLDKSSAYRDRKTSARKIAASTDPEDNLLRANEQFARARRYVPIEPICLLDSLSLLRFLSRRGLPANIVFSVTPEPFAAHCWVQAGVMVLNETLSDANVHTPIRKV